MAASADVNVAVMFVALQVLDPNELRREIDYYSERQTLEQKSTTQNMKAQNSEAGKALINTEAKRTEPE